MAKPQGKAAIDFKWIWENKTSSWPTSGTGTPVPIWNLCSSSMKSTLAFRRGLYRLQQFSKGEIFIFCQPEDSNMHHEELIQIEDLFTSLGFNLRYWIWQQVIRVHLLTVYIMRTAPVPDNFMAKPIVAFAFLVILCALSLAALAKPHRRPISDNEVGAKKTACYADIESGLWGSKCTSSMIEKENCALRCLSPVCYELIYESDPLEEGEKDYVRAQEFKYCMHKLSLGENLDGVKGAFE
ncbi:hypothetical protein J5N97_018884 [Dioscorea zingiberensis]|uniref:Uncharacterized protein n=1 Tax=Dioscorea zingiberensis TaxID=325984 RepID=A0A9D5CDP7_9LILI|nr:hypothetical protein J5N97_018884 [Dioscorea zingiberensis]